MSVFLENGYLDFEKLYNDPSPFIFCVGARGTGKTFGSLQFCYQQGLKFIYLRSKDNVVKKLSNEMMNPFKPVNEELGIEVELNNKKTGGVPVFQERVEDQIKVIGYMMPLSTFANFRGFDLSDIDVIIYDEFIPEAGERPVKDQAATLFNMYETVNRNRELKGSAPVKLICLSNSNTIFNDIFLSLKLTRKVYSMMVKGQLYYRDIPRGISLFNIQHSPISQKKKETALYKLTIGSDFQEMALENRYSIQYENLIKSQNIQHYKPVVIVGETCIYRNDQDLYYMTTFKKGVFPAMFSMAENDLIKFRHDHYSIWKAFLSNRLYFEDIYCLEVFNLIYF